MSDLWVLAVLWGIIFAVIGCVLVYVAWVEAKEKAQAEAEAAWQREEERARRQVRYQTIRNERKNHGNRR